MRYGAIFVICMLLAACGDDIQFEDPPKKAAAPASTGMANHAAHANSGTQPVGTHGEAPDPFADPEEKDDNSAPQSANESGVVFSGTVKVASGFELTKAYAVFVSAYVAGTRMPAYTKKYEKPVFPFTFELTTSDAPFGKPPKDGTFEIAVIFSEDGYVTPGPGKFSKTKFEGTFSNGSKDIVLTVKE